MEKRYLTYLAVIALFLCISSATYAAPILNSYNGHYYEAISAEIDWLEAENIAESSTYQGVAGHLATLTSIEEHNWVWENLGYPFRYYLGASDREVEGVWKWVTGESWVFTNWKTVEPNNGNGWYQEDALAFYYEGKWNDLPDTHNIIVDNPNYRYIYGYVVEYDTVVPEPATLLLFPLGLLSAYFLKKNKK